MRGSRAIRWALPAGPVLEGDPFKHQRQERHNRGMDCEATPAGTL